MGENPSKLGPTVKMPLFSCVLFVAVVADYSAGGDTQYESEPESYPAPSLHYTTHKAKCADGCPCVDPNNPCFDPTTCSCKPVKCQIVREFWHGFSRGSYSNLAPQFIA